MTVNCTSAPTDIPSTPATGSNGNLRMSGYNLAVVLAGLPADLITPWLAEP